MAWVAVDEDREENIYEILPKRKTTKYHKYWFSGMYTRIQLPKGSILKLIGRELTWDDEPVELKEDKPTPLIDH